MKKGYGFGLMCCLVATISWGVMFPVMTSALQYVDAFNFTTIRYAIAGVAFSILLFFMEGKSSFNLKGERWGLAWLFGTAGFAGFGFLVFLGQHLAGKTGALTASIMMATMPMIGLLVVWRLKKTRPAASTFGFISLSFSGVLLVITNGNFSAVANEPTNWIANLLLIFGALCWVLYTVGASYFPKWSPIRYTAITTMLGWISVAVIDSLLVSSNQIDLPKKSDLIAIVPHLIYMSLIAGLLAVLCWNVGNKILTPTNGVLFMDIVPITAFTVSALNGVLATKTQIVGAVITATALVLNNINQRKIAKQK